MKSWDLCPGELVTLDSATERIDDARFAFRDTVRACFYIDEELREFRLHEDGGLVDQERVKLGLFDILLDRDWRIAGADRHTRFVAREERSHFA